MIDDVGLTVSSVRTVSTCTGTVCDGLYGLGNCPCVSVSSVSRQALAFHLYIHEFDDNNVKTNRLHTMGLKVSEFSSIKLTDALVKAEDLEVITI